MDFKFLDEYESEVRQPRAAIAGLTQADLLAKPVPGTWSIQQIVIHLMDSDLIWTDRAKRIIAEENPTLIGYDETGFANNLFYEKWSAEDALTIFELNRINFAKILRSLPPAAFERCGLHSERGEVRLGDQIRHITGHVEHHLKFIRRKRAMLGKPV